MSLPTTTHTSLYRYYDLHRVLIYVGITGRGVTRNIEHNSTKDWWRHVDHQEVDHFPTREDALKEEKRLIRRYRPPFNKQHNPFHDELRTIYEAYANSPADPGGMKPKPAALLDLYRFSGKKVPLRRVSRGGKFTHFISDESSAPLVSALDADLYGFRVGMIKKGVARVERQRDRLLVHLRGQGSEGVEAVSAHLACVCTNPVRFQVRSVRPTEGTWATSNVGEEVSA